MKRLIFCLAVLVLALAARPAPLFAQAGGPLRLEITEGVIEPMPIAVAPFLSGTANAGELAARISAVVVADLAGSGLFRAIPAEAQIAQVTSFDAPVRFADWKAINAQALVTGTVERTGADRVAVSFRLFDVFAGAPLGDGMRFEASEASWRRLAHKVADTVYQRLTGEPGYFDSRIAFVSETGPKNARRKRLALMDQDGANLRYLTGDMSIVLAPRFSPDGRQILYTSYESGLPRAYLLDLETLGQRPIDNQAGVATFAPRFSPDGLQVVYSLERGGNTDIHITSLVTGQTQRLTETPAIETAPDFSPDGRQIVFESDRSGTQQIYVMPAAGGPAQRISAGQGRYGTPVWSPRGDRIAFTKQQAGRFHIGVMRTDGTGERLLTASFLDEGPSWAPNGRLLIFTRVSQGEAGAPSLYTVDVTGRNLRAIATPDFASDPTWSPLLP